MPELHFKGKEYVYNHHLNVPFRPLIAQPDKSIGEDSGNLIIHGDNLHALKALLPRYAGKVDCIFIDPPYNTGNENWCYNDNVNSPIMRDWLNSNPVNKEDMLRHDKWLSMMWPRLKLLHELLSETGSFWMTLDDNEVHRARMMLDEIFGEERFVALFTVVNNLKGRNDKEHVALTHEYILVYSNDEFMSQGLELSQKQLAEFNQVTPDGQVYALRDLRKRGSEDRREDRPNMFFPIYWDVEENSLFMERRSPTDREILPKRGDGTDGRWRWGKDRVSDNQDILVPRVSDSGKIDVDYMVFVGGEDSDSEAIRRKPKSFWQGSEYSTDTATTLLKNIFGFNPLSHAPKSLAHVQRCIELSMGKTGIVLDSFAGSATTAHAVLTQNAKDGGNRQFILVECEDYADSLTAERVRRVINGYEFEGTQKEELHREKITWSNFSKDGPRHKLLQHVQSIENIDGLRFDTIKKEIKDGELIVTGENKITEQMPGLGGGFTFYTLGEPLDIDKILTGETLPDYSALGAWLFHTATGQPLNVEQIDTERWYLGCSSQYHVWLIYRPDLDFLKSPQAALTLSVAETIGQTHKDKSHLVFAPAKYAPNRLLLPLGVEYAPLPFALYRIEKD